jgi:hypothetical protein
VSASQRGQQQTGVTGEGNVVGSDLDVARLPAIRNARFRLGRRHADKLGPGMAVSATEISTEGGRLPMVWWEQPEAADEFAIVLPGQWFGCGSPPTAYATLALQALGADVAWDEKRLAEVGLRFRYDDIRHRSGPPAGFGAPPLPR